MVPLKTFPSLQKGDGQEEHKHLLGDLAPQTVSTHQPSPAQNMWLRLGTLSLLSIAALICIGLSTASKMFGGYKDQSCGVFSDTCMTQQFLTVFSIFVGVANIVLFGWEFFRHYKEQENKGKLIDHFLAGVLEDANHIVAFMLLAATFATLSGVHDDFTVLFDLLVVLFVGLLQSMQHHIMLQRESVIQYCKDNKRKTWTDHLGREVSVDYDVMNYFLYTRLFIFALIIGSVVAFLQRIEPSILSNGTSATWNHHMRNVALIVSVLPHVVSDVAYEIHHAYAMRTNKTHTPYVGPSFWRRTVYLLYMIAYMLLSWKTYNFEGPSTTAA